MATHARIESLDILDPNHASLPDSTTFALSDVDQHLPGNHTTPCIVFPFSGSRADVVQYLSRGLANVVACIPIAAGELHVDGDPMTGPLSVIRQNHVPVKLTVHYLDEGDHELKFPSYAELAARSFPPSVFSGCAASLRPPGANLAGFRRDTGCPVSAFQANFIQGGVIITAAMHHMVIDAYSIGHTVRLWAASTRAASIGEGMPSFAPVLDRTYFSVGTPPPTWEEIQDKKKNIGVYVLTPIAEKKKDEETPAASLVEPPPPPPVEIAMYRFEREQIDALKKICLPADSKIVDFVSSYDVMCGLVWRCMTRARLPYWQQMHADKSAEAIRATPTMFAHPVDSRGRVADVPEAYFGNGFSMMATDDIAAGDLVGADNDDSQRGLAKAAQLIRQATQRFTRDTIPDLVAVRRGIAGREEMSWPWAPENVVSTSWTGMRAMTDFDFGFGKPAAVRLPVPPFVGILGVLPGSRVAGQDGDGDVDSAFDVYVVLEKACQDRLRTDPELLQYCTEIGREE